ncbi:hypothetical protein GCM10027066_30410 [Dyella jejuensis]
MFGWIVFKVNAIKELNMDAPLMPADVLLSHQMTHNIGFFAHYTGYRALLLLLLALVSVAVTGLVWWLEKKWYRPNWISRIIYVTLALTALITLFNGNGFWGAAYSSKALPGFDKWAPILTVRENGLMASLVKMSQAKPLTIPKPDTSIVKQFARDNKPELVELMHRQLPGELPDIVIVQSEAFFDPGVMKDVDFGQYAPNFERLASTGITGSLTTPTYGGGTIRTEFETLTGYPMAAFPLIAYPYFGLAADWMPTVPRRLASMGYSTELFHPFRSDFWNREDVMPGLGFHHSYYEDAFVGAQRAGSYISDHALFDTVLARLDQASTKPRYIMAITMENHGPWDRDDALMGPLKGKPLPSGLSPQGKVEMTYYLSHLVNGDEALGDFAKRLLARPRWTILVFYGDHLPALSAAFADLGFDDDKLPRHEHTRYMLLSNRPIATDQPRKIDLHSYDLPGLLFDVAGLPEDGYLALSSTMRRQRVREHAESGIYEQLQYNAAIMEVRCQHALSLSGGCTLLGSIETAAKAIR